MQEPAISSPNSVACGPEANPKGLIEGSGGLEDQLLREYALLSAGLAVLADSDLKLRRNCDGGCKVH